MHFMLWYRCGICLYRGLSGASCDITINACSSRILTTLTSYSNVCDICGGTNIVCRQCRCGVFTRYGTLLYTGSD